MGDDVRFWLSELGASAREIGRVVAWAIRTVWGARAAVLHCSAVVLGWASVTWGVAALLVPEVWQISLGLFLLSLAGWGHLRVVFASGVYALHRKKDVR
jgi:hypothetical protein